jgi:hypothetical protein
MHFLAGTIIVLAIIFFMIVSPGFRAFAILLLVSIAVLIGIAIKNSSEESERRSREYAAQAATERSREATARSLIPIAALKITDTSLTRGALDWRFRGVVKNDSEYALTEMNFSLSINDCSRSPCVTIGESTANVLNIMVPPNQARSFDASATFSNLPQASSWQWVFKVTGTRALPK